MLWVAPRLQLHLMLLVRVLFVGNHPSVGLGLKKMGAENGLRHLGKPHLPALFCWY